jgi:uncharacterized protein YkwD
LRKLAAAVLAVPVVATIYLPILFRRRIVLRLGAGGLAVALIAAIATLGLAAPPPTVATAPLPPVVPLSTEAFNSTVSADSDLEDPVSVTFSAPMDPRSVAAALDVSPPANVELAWDETATQLTITPKGRWLPDTYHTITVRPGALSATGKPMAVPARAVFVTRAATTATLAATALEGDRATVASGFLITFDQPVEIGAVRKALTIEPAVRGSLDLAAAADDGTAFVFTPAEPLLAGTAYSVRLAGLEDAGGVPIEGAPELAVTTTDAPEVVRFRPAHKTGDVEQTAALSVRFTQPMDQASTKAAWVVTAGGKPVPGTVSFAESDTVLVFRPSAPMPYDAEVEMLVKDSATSAAGAPLATASSVRIRIESKPAPPSSGGSGGSSGGSGGSIGSGGAVGGGSWGAVETYYLNLMNCTRTGGWVTSSGSCSSPGGRNVAALKLDAGISAKVARPYAKRLATGNQCTHFLGGNPGNRLSAAGYTSYIWAENLGCRSGDPKKAVLGSHLYFQSENTYNGGHWVNMMNSKYDRVGIGVWVSGGRVRLVVDFYHPR